MANSKSLHSQTGASFSRFLIASATGASLATTGNAVVAMPLLDGGMTNGGGAGNSGGVIVRQVTFQNPNKDVSTANVTIFTSNDGNASNVVVAAATLGNLSAVGKFQDMTIASPFNLTTSITGNNSQALFLKVGTAVSDGTVDIRVYGDIVNF